MDLFDVFAKITLDSSEYERAISSAASSSKNVQAAINSLKTPIDNIKNAFNAVTHPVETVKTGWENLKSAASGLVHPIENIKNKIQEQQTSAQQNQAIMAGLAKQYDEAKQKVADLTKQFQDSVKETGVASDESIRLANALKEAEGKAGSAEKAITSFASGESEAGDEAEETEGKLAKLVKTMGKGLVAVAKVGLTGLATAGTAIGKVVYESVQKFSEYEQNIGGIQKLYGNAGMSVEDYATSVGKSVEEIKGEYDQLTQAQNLVLENAQNAYQTAGMSANEYMTTATSFSAALINSLEGDTVKAAEQTDVAMRAISDNFNTFGGDIGMIQGAFQGFAKQNYTMLDNLKLGYGGTKTEMERLIADANEYAKANGQAADLTIDSFSDIVTAIELVQEKQGIAGTTAREAATTIQGSLGMTKAAWENLVTGLSDKDADISKLVSNFVDSGKTLVNNIAPVVTQALSSIETAIGDVAPALVKEAINLISTVLPDLVKSARSLLDTVIDTLISNAGQLVDAAVKIVGELARGLLTAAPKLITGAFQLIAELARGLGEALPTLIPQIVNIVMQMALALTDPSGLAAILNGALSLMQGLANGILAALPLVINTIPVLIQNLVDFIVQNAPQFLVSAAQIIIQLAVGLIQAVPELLAKLPEIMDSIVNGLIELAPQLWEAAKSIVGELWNGIKNIFGGKKQEQINVADNIDFSGVTADAQQTATTVSTAFSGMNTTLDFSAAQTSATTQFDAISASATTAKDNVVASFTGMGTEIGNSIASGQGSVDWSALEAGAKTAAANMKAAFTSFPSTMRSNWTKIKGYYTEVPTWLAKQFTVAKENIMSTWSLVPDEFRAIWTSIKTTFNDADTYFKTVGSKMHDNLMDGLDLDSIENEIANATGGNGGTNNPAGGNKPTTRSISRAGTNSLVTDSSSLEKRVEKIYTLLSAYIPEIAEKTGVSIDSIDNALGFRSMMVERGNA